MNSRSLLLVAAALALAGCATLSKDECRSIDWRTVGYEDGAAGYSGQRVAEHRKACAKHGVAVDLDAYQAGRAEGLREYCEPYNGFRVGSRGGDYQGQCPADMAGAFTSAWETGRELYLLERRVTWADQQLAARRAELEDIEHQIASLTTVIVGDRSTSEQRAQALLDTKQLAERHGRIQAEIPELERDRIVYRQELEDFRATVAYIG